jgi:isoleucyl-tRNA synthetase
MGVGQFVVKCKQSVLHYAAMMTEQSIRLGMWMDWNDPDSLRLLRDKLGEDPQQVITVAGPQGPVTGTVEQIVGRLGLPELGGSYFTFSDKNNYDIWGFLRKCHNNGWIYKGTDVMPWCWRCGTALSQHEIVTEGYFEQQDPGLTVRFPLLDRPGEALLVWTTTPWTLTSNVAAAVGPELTYVKVRQGDEAFYLSKGTTHILQGPYEMLEELPGRALEGWRYAGPFDELPAEQHVGGWSEPSLRRLFANVTESAVEAHRVILWEEVGEAEGTGIVHIAPGCGAEDYQLHKRDNLPVVAPLDENGYYIEGFGWLSGLHVAGVAGPIVENLKAKGRFYRQEAYTHRYPHCWRCDTPLVFRLVDEWYINMDGLRPPLMEVTNQIRWIPEYGRERELDWLRNMHDWMLSKKRYYGLALPIWECEQCGRFDVLGSKEELEQRAVEGWEEFKGHTPHRPFIDAVKIACSHCGGRSHRIRDVGNPWLDAGIVGLSTLRYGTDPDYWRKWFPADFITESFPGQFRNWFYSFLTMATALVGEKPTRTILGFSTLLAEDGRPMHKSWGNSIEFNEAADSPDFGADVMRWMFFKQRYEADILFGKEHAKETRRSFFLPLWNVYSFFVTYANLDHWAPEQATNPLKGPAPALGQVLGAGDAGRTARKDGGQVTEEESRNELDRWILARLNELVGEVTAALDDYIAYRAARPIEEFVADLSNWYVRRSRRRFWKSEADSDKQSAYRTLYEVLVTLSKLLAPSVPFTAEAFYQNLVRSVDPQAPLSVHHCLWPEVRPEQLDRELLDAMAVARKVVTLGHAIRSSANLKVRQPLARAVAVVAPEQRNGLMRMRELVQDELNVKALELASKEADLISYNLLPNNKLLGPRFGARFPRVRAALAAVDPAAAAEVLRSGQPLRLRLDGEVAELVGDEVLVNPLPRPGFAVASDADTGVVVALDTALTPELRAEGLAREVVRRIQDLRKSGGFDISDRVVTYYSASPELAGAINHHRDYLKAETLSVELISGVAPAGAATASDEFDGESLTIGLVKAGPLANQAPEVVSEYPGARNEKELTKEQTMTAEMDDLLAEQRAVLAALTPAGHTPKARAAEMQKVLAEQRAALAKLVKIKAVGKKKPARKRSTKKTAVKKAGAKKAAKKTAKKAAKKVSAKSTKKASKKAAKKTAARKKK